MDTAQAKPSLGWVERAALGAVFLTANILPIALFVFTGTVWAALWMILNAVGLVRLIDQSREIVAWTVDLGARASGGDR